MDPNTTSGTLSSHTAFEEDVAEQETSLSGSQRETEAGGNILLQLLEFKTHLHEAVEELHIRRDAETRFEHQISQLVVEKQELEWEKESLEQQIETMTNQHTESLAAANKQFQVKLQHIEEEKGKYQVTAELKDREISNLKEELKSLQLLKYNLEKKSSELEQKLALQSRTKDTHLSQLGEAEKRFGALSRSCAVVKKAHEKLEQNVFEAMRINNKLTSANHKQEETIVSLKKELDGVRYKLIKEQMKFAINKNTHNPAGQEQRLQELQQKLKLETERSKKLREENIAEHREKQELMRFLQQNQQLLLNQTRATTRLELELRTQTEAFQALEREHKAVREKSEAMEDEVGQLTQSYAASRSSWDKEKRKIQDQLKSEQQDLREMNGAYEDLQQKLAELSGQRRSEEFCVSTIQFPSIVEDLRGKDILEDPISSSELPAFDSPGDLRDLGAASSANGDQGELSHQPQQQHILEDPNTLKRECPESFSLSNNSGGATKMEIFSASGVLTVTDEDHQNHECGSLEGSAHLPTKGTDERKRRTTEKQKNRKQEEDVTKQKSKDGCGEKEVKDVRNAEEMRTTDAQTDGTDMSEGAEGSSNAAGETSAPETEIRDKGERELTDGVKEGGQTAESPETQIQALKTTDRTQKSLSLQVNDFMDTEPPLAVCEFSNSSKNLPQIITDKHADCNRPGRERTVDGKVNGFGLDEHQSVSSVPEPDAEAAHPDSPVEVQTVHQDPERSDLEHEKTSTEMSGYFPAEGPSPCTSQTPQSHNIQESETNPTQTEHCDPRAVVAVETTKEMFGADEESVSVTNMAEAQSLEASEKQERVQLRSVVDEDGRSESSTCESAERAAAKEDVEEQSKTDQGSGGGEGTKNDADPKISHQQSGETAESSEPGRSKNQPLKQKRPTDSAELSQISRSLFDWTAQRKTFSDFSVLHEFTQGTHLSGRPLDSAPVFSKTKHDKAQQMITKASDLFSTFGVSAAASLSKSQRRGRGVMEETCRETAEKDRTSSVLSISSSASQASQQPSSETSCSPVAPGSELDQEPSCSLERDDQQSSLRAQISKIEAFLNTERLRLPKRRRIESPDVSGSVL
ncbi:coiled-coil domain-containing protein 73 isoform X2 [Nothobranchius furzeri]|uniref:coiled-coil domain-containing protein 73 isoform X2 n=1 Tax=Nothobranchius furzeri TaxID=105023 RepID=UPI003904BFF4